MAFLELQQVHTKRWDSSFINIMSLSIDVSFNLIIREIRWFIAGKQLDARSSNMIGSLWPNDAIRVRQWLVVCRCKSITWTNVNKLSVMSCGIHLTVISHEMLKDNYRWYAFKHSNLNLGPDLQGANALMTLNAVPLWHHRKRMYRNPEMSLHFVNWQQLSSPCSETIPSSYQQSLQCGCIFLQHPVLHTSYNHFRSYGLQNYSNQIDLLRYIYIANKMTNLSWCPSHGSLHANDNN